MNGLPRLYLFSAQGESFLFTQRLCTALDPLLGSRAVEGCGGSASRTLPAHRAPRSCKPVLPAPSRGGGRRRGDWLRRAGPREPPPHPSSVPASPLPLLSWIAGLRLAKGLGGDGACVSGWTVGRMMGAGSCLGKQPSAVFGFLPWIPPPLPLVAADGWM